MTNDSGFLTSHQDLSGYVPRSGGPVLEGESFGRTVNDSKFYVCGGTSTSNGACVSLCGKDHTSFAGYVSLKAQDNSNYSQLIMRPSGTFTFDNNGTTKNVAMQEDTIPRIGGAVMTGELLGRNVNNSYFAVAGGTAWRNGAMILIYGKDESSYNPTRAGAIQIRCDTGSNAKEMLMYPSGTWTWQGTAVQLVSDKRLKQQIAEIDDALLDAWEDVTLCQFKYNDAVNEKGDNARLHTGYVVQQIDEACQKHDIDISAYGLYCHEEYPERTEEVTIENEDGTTSKETKVIEPAKEYYSLRYTEALIVECAYLRREVSRLKQQNENLEQRLKMLEQSVK